MTHPAEDFAETAFAVWRKRSFRSRAVLRKMAYLRKIIKLMAA
jgi:hypothetical protein